MTEHALLFRIRAMILFFMFALIASGLTAFPLTWEVGLMISWFGEGTPVGNAMPALAQWLTLIHEGLLHNDQHYPFIAYGTDWLAFAHLMIALAFLGPLRNPIQNQWVIDWGMICCACVIPLAFFCGMALRNVPWGWCLVDCSFGVFGIIPLLFIRRWIGILQRMQNL